MRNYVIAAAILAVALPNSPAMARQINGYTVRTTTMRAGPDSDYPAVRRLRTSSSVIVYGCLNDWNWCDVSYRSDRGWVAGDDIVVNYQGQRRRIMPSMGIGILSFMFGSYWDSHYRSRPFYSERPRWEQQYNNGYRPQWGPRPGAPSVTPQYHQPDVGGHLQVAPQRPAFPQRQVVPNVPMGIPQLHQPNVGQHRIVPTPRQAAPITQAPPAMQAQPNRQVAPGAFNRGKSQAPGQQRGGQPGNPQGQSNKDHKPKD